MCVEFELLEKPCKGFKQPYGPFEQLEQLEETSMIRVSSAIRPHLSQEIFDPSLKHFDCFLRFILGPGQVHYSTPIRIKKTTMLHEDASSRLTRCWHSDSNIALAAPGAG